jgi:lipopolysaccharide biosynthesis glycosyltransferase
MFWRNPDASEPIALVTACDENYVCGAAAAVRSAIASLEPQRPLTVYVLDGGIAERSKAGFLRSWNSRPLDVKWLQPNLAAFRDLPAAEGASPAVYLRLLMAELLPDHVNKAIYLDADTIVVRDLTGLWSVPLEGTYCAAVQDSLVPVMDPAEAFDHPLHCMTLADTHQCPIPNYRDLGLRPADAYFNSGVMLVDVARWRAEQVARRAMECLRANASHARFWDQYALNVLFAGQWKMLDPRWNQNSHVFQLPSWELSHYSESELARVKRDPWIVHFNYRPKPWDVDCDHPFRTLFCKHLEGTLWDGDAAARRNKAA